jgi:hypothetical protein
MNPKKFWINFALLIVITASSGLLTACSQKEATTTGSDAGSMPGHGGYAMAPMDKMPEEVKNSAEKVKSSYSFAAANPDILKRLPCYCGCGAMGHRSLYDCYVSSIEPGGKINYDTHALGCSICVDIAQDAMRLLNQGKTVEQVKTYVDQTYAQYGTSNLP